MNHQRMTKKGFRYDEVYLTDISSRRVKDFSEYASMYNRLAELEDKIEKGLLVPRYSIWEDKQFKFWCIREVDEQGLITEQYRTFEEAKRKLEELQK